MDTEQEHEMESGYQVQVDDNFHYMDEDERWVLGNFPTYAEALSAAKAMVEESVRNSSTGKIAEDLYNGYISHGDDPFIVAFGDAPQPEEMFSAWNYAKEYAERLEEAWGREKK